MSDQPTVNCRAIAVTADGPIALGDWRGAAEPAEGWVWVELDRWGDGVEDWLTRRSGAPLDVAWALLEEDTQPRARAAGEGALLVLRGVNLNPGAEPSDMVSVRLFITARRIISVSLRPLRAVAEMEARVEAGGFPKTPAAFVTQFVEDIRARAEPILDGFQARLESLEDSSFDGSFTPQNRQDLNALRRSVSHTRRYVGPQARALVALTAFSQDWLPAEQRNALHEESAAFDRMAGDLDSLLDRAAIVRDEVDTKIAERANRILLLFSVVGAVFLPLTFMTGLLGVNLAGIPAADQSWAFAALAGLLAALGVLEILLIRWLKLF
jgi:zinc transporter